MASLTGMKAGGFYDRHSSLQRTTFDVVYPKLAASIATMPLPEEPAVLGVADYGCSEGSNSIYGMGRIVKALRARRPHRSVAVMHTDLATNDFNHLLGLLLNPGTETYAQKYGAPSPGVFPMLVGASFYGPVLPPACVHVGISMLAVEWLSQPIAHPPADHIGILAGDAAALADGRAQAEADWRLFLAERGREIVPGGRLLVSVPGRNETDWCARGPYDLLNRACRELVAEGRIDAGRYAAFCFPVYPRAADELATPAAEGGLFAIEHCETLDVPIGFECAFDADGDVAAYATALVGAWKAVSEPVLRAALLRPGDDPASIDAVYQRAEALVRADPRPWRFRNLEVSIQLLRR